MKKLIQCLVLAAFTFGVALPFEQANAAPITKSVLGKASAKPEAKAKKKKAKKKRGGKKKL
jgi:hypothetical protein